MKEISTLKKILFFKYIFLFFSFKKSQDTSHDVFKLFHYYSFLFHYYFIFYLQLIFLTR